MKLLLDIQTGYRDFHAQSLERIGMHPGACASELATLKTELVDFHHVVTREEYHEHGHALCRRRFSVAECCV